MFFDTKTLLPTKRATLATLPPIPETNWRPPTSFPTIDGAVMIGIDTEVKEDDFDHGPGWSRGKSQIAGASVDIFYRDNTSTTVYLPARHTLEPQYNIEPWKVFSYLKYVCETPHIPKVGANLIYDIGNLQEEGIQVMGELHDIEIAEALLDEEAFVSLDAQDKKYLNKGKTTDLLYPWCAKAYGGEPTGKQRENIWRCSPRLVGPYGESDARDPRLILMKQWKQLEAENLLQVYRMECDLLPLWVRMRRQGVRVDINKAEKIYTRLTPLIANLYNRVREMSKINLESTTGNDIKKVFRSLGIKMPLTDKGNESATAEWLKQLDHPISPLILEIRQMETIKNTFLANYILGANVNGIVHGEYHPLRNDTGGTRTGRLSSSNPNLTNIPTRTNLGKEIRSCFIPFEGHSCWHKGDFSQIQYRGLAHYAVGPGANELRAEYIRDPKTDYHDRTQAMVKSIVGITIPRKPIKNLNFANVMGAGKNKVKRMIQLDSGDLVITDKMADDFYMAYHKGNGYVKATLAAMSDEAMRVGYVPSPLGRRSRFNMWEPKNDDWDNRSTPLPYEQAIRVYGSQIQRANTYMSVSHRLQGLEADIIKSAMRQALTDGVYDVIGVPTTVVHDEKNHSVIDESPRQNEAYRYMHYLMENTLKINVPVRFEADRGPNWGEITEDKETAFSWRYSS